MKRFLQRWLGIDDIEGRLDVLGITALKGRVYDLECEVTLYGGTTGKHGGIKEHIWAMTEHLNLRPQETYEIIPTIVNEETVRHFKLVPRDAPYPEFAVTRRNLGGPASIEPPPKQKSRPKHL